MRKIILIVLAFLHASAWAKGGEPVPAHMRQPDFVKAVVREARAKKIPLGAAQVNKWLAQAQFQPTIVQAISRPAEAKPWREYAPLFLTEARIGGGASFFCAHRALLGKVSKQYGVPAEMLVAIIGVETHYGKIVGNYRGLDALATLGFYYPPRQDFFRDELKHLMLISAQGLLPAPLPEIKGSYAGAMGMPQFMPSSYMKYAVDGDGDGRIDLWQSMPDVAASIANYFVQFGWENGQPVAERATRGKNARSIAPQGLEPVYSVKQLADWGYEARRAPTADLPATLLALEAENGSEYWLAFRNFYVITRYNRSPLYSMAVHQLAKAIKLRAQDACR